jgi:hypothetical protein
VTLFPERPPNNIAAGKLQLFPKRFDYARELGLIVSEIDQDLIGILFALSQEDASAIGENPIRAERVCRFQFCLRPGVRSTHRPPAHPGGNKGIDESQLQKVAKAQRKLVLNRAKLALPNGIGVAKTFATLEVIAF